MLAADRPQPVDTSPQRPGTPSIGRITSACASATPGGTVPWDSPGGRGRVSQSVHIGVQHDANAVTEGKPLSHDPECARLGG